MKNTEKCTNFNLNGTLFKHNSLMKTMRNYIFISKEIGSVNKACIPIQLLYGLFSALYSTVGLYFPKWIINEITQQGRKENIVFLVLFMVTSIMLVKFLTMLIETYNSDNHLRNMYQLAVKVNQKYMTDSYIKTQEESEQNRHKKAYNAARKLSSMISNVNVHLISSIIRISITIYFIIYIDIMCAVILLTSTLTMYFINKRIGNAIYDYDNKAIKDERKQEFLSTLSMNVDKAKQIRLSDLQNYLLNKYEILSRNIIANEKKKHGVIRWNRVLASFVDILQNVSVYLFMTYSFFEGNISIADFVVAIPMLTAFVNASRDLINCFATMDTINLYAEDYKGYIENSEKKSGMLLTEEISKIEFRNVFFKYPGMDDYALKAVNCTIHNNENVMIVGENGAGKSTFIKLLLRLYEPTAGEILVNGINISKLEINSYLRKITAVFQDFQLFNYSLKDNLCFGDIEKEKKMDDVLKYMDLDSVISELENGVDTYIMNQMNVAGKELSGGQRQKVAICRAILKEGEIGILDEPTAALDPIAEFRLFEKYEKKKQNNLSIFISHRMALARICDRIIIINKGVIEEFGKHDDLIKKNGIYAKMYNSQAKLYTIN